MTGCSDYLEEEVGVSIRRRVLMLRFRCDLCSLKFDRILRCRDDIEVILVTRDNYFLFTPCFTRSRQATSS
jgi:hypothetical protein